MNNHLVILKKVYVDAIIKGRKTIESRLYRTKHKWLSQIDAGDRLFLKASSGPVMATATVAAVKHFDNLNPEQIATLKDKYNHYKFSYPPPCVLFSLITNYFASILWHSSHNVSILSGSHKSELLIDL